MVSIDDLKKLAENSLVPKKVKHYLDGRAYHKTKGDEQVNENDDKIYNILMQLFEFIEESNFSITNNITNITESITETEELIDVFNGGVANSIDANYYYGDRLNGGEADTIYTGTVTIVDGGNASS